MNDKQREFEQLCTAFASGKERGEQAWFSLQALAKQGFQPAQIFVSMQKLKSPPPLHDLGGAIDLLEGLVAETAVQGADTRLRTTSLYGLGEALICHCPDRLNEGYQLLEDAALLGHVEAQLGLAYCLRRGVGTQADNDASTQWLRKAAAQGHPRAMFELGIQLATGEGSEGNVQEAINALQRASSYNYPAAGAMAARLAGGNDLTLPDQNRKVLSSSPGIEQIFVVLDPMECSHLAALSMPHLKPSRVISDQRSGQFAGGRTSQGMNFHHGLRDVVVTSIIRRLCGLAGCEFSQTEALTVLMYHPGAEYRLHPDYFRTDTDAGKMQLRNGGQRIKTIICYLNEVGEGGETAFPELNIRVRPEPGSVVYFENADKQGQPFLESRHAGLPVLEGIKWISTLWIRQLDYDQWEGSL
jgi:prolyl 4-hydroxylase